VPRLASRRSACTKLGIMLEYIAMDTAGDDVEAGAGSSARPDTFRKPKWTSELDALLLRELKLHKPQEQRHGQKGNVYENMAFNLNECARLPWKTDRKHLQGRVQHLLEARRAYQRETARATGIEEEHGELEVLLDDVIVESGCVTLQSLVLSIKIMRKDLWELLHDIYTSVLTEWTYESITYKLYLTRREMPRITHHVSDVSVVTCLMCNGHVYTSNL
jgi:hypothetical protein